MHLNERGTEMGGNVFGKRNFLVLAFGVVLLILGYIFLGQGPVFNPISWVVAPIVLVVTYLVVIPLSVLSKNKEVDSSKK